MRKKEEDSYSSDYEEENNEENYLKDEEKISQKDDSLQLNYDEDENLNQINEDNNQPKINNENNEFNYQENRNINNQLNFSNYQNENFSLRNNMINNRHYNEGQIYIGNIMNNPNNNLMNYYNPNVRQVPFNLPIYNSYNNMNNLPPFFQNFTNQMDNSFYYPNNPNQYNSRGANNINNNSSINLRKKNVTIKSNNNINNIRKNNNNNINNNIKINENLTFKENKNNYDKSYMQILKNIVIDEANKYILNDYRNKVEGCSVNCDDNYSIIYVIKSCPEKKIYKLNNKLYKNYQSYIADLEDKLSSHSITIYDKIYFPEITDKIISRRIEVLNYKLTENDKLIIDNFNKNLKINNKQFIINENMFYSKPKMSLYYPHILKKTNDIRSIFLNDAQKKLNVKDFQYCAFHNNEHCLFIKILQRRILQFNDNKFNKNNEKNFGFYKNYMYTTIDKDIVKEILRETKFEELKNNLLFEESKVSESQSVISTNIEFINKKNIQYIKGLSYEEIITYLILSKLKYNELPRIIFYECYINIKGERIIETDQGILPGYQEIDYAMLSHSYFDFGKYNYPLYIQTQFFINKNGKFITMEPQETSFEIKEDILYFFEFKYSLESLKKDTKAEDFLERLFKVCKELTSLYINKKFVDKRPKVEIIIIYDDKVNNELIKYKNKIEEFLRSNKKFKIKIVYSAPNYSYFYPSLIKDELNELKEEHKKLKEENVKREEEHKKLKEENVKREEEYKSLKEECKILREENKILKEDNAKREEEYKKIMEEINMLKNK